MNLRIKTFSITGLLFAVVLVLLYLAARLIILDSYRVLEEKSSLRDLTRAVNALENETDRIARLTTDWASWDDSYAFIQDRGDEYVEINMTTSTFETLRVSLFLYVHASGEVVFGRVFDLKEGRSVDVTEIFFTDLASDPLIAGETEGDETRSGLVFLPEGLMLAASRPILTSDYKGPSRGRLIVGRFLDETEISRLSEITDMAITAYPLSDKEMPASFREAVDLLLEGSSPLVRPANEEMITAFTLLDDIHGEPALVMSIDQPREIYAHGRKTLFYFVLAFMTGGLILGLANIYLLDRQVLSRLTGLSRKVKEIGRSRDLSARVTVEGEDELSSLAGEINGMLEELSVSDEALRQARTDLEKKVEERTEALRKALEGLEKQNVELKKLDRMKDALIRDVTHKLKTPVAKHAMELEILKTGLMEDAPPI